MRLSFDSAVTLFGAGPIVPRDIEEILAIAPVLIAADGGANAALAAGHVPEAVIGDFDSLSAEFRHSIPSERLFLVTEQDSTDFEKCLSRIDAPLTLALGFTGRRLDHELAVYNALVRYPDHPCIVLGSHDLAFAAPAEVALDLAPGDRVSLFPMAEVTGRSEGLRWPIEGLRLAPDGRVGTSNVAIGPVRLSFDGPGMLIILPRRALGVARAALMPG